MTMKVWITAGLAASTLLAACGAMPDARYRDPFYRPTYGPPVANPSPGGGPAPDQAEMACVAAGHDAGFDVERVVGTRELMGPQATATSRDVMLRVRRGGQSLEVRCNYAYDTGQARIMTL
ncbi:MAG: hypothetical protein KDK12_19135 [Rhodobacteraceae bacterium]|nr:hypothetical protein [Paracoccaceae bacterium]